MLFPLLFHNQAYSCSTTIDQTKFLVAIAFSIWAFQYSYDVFVLPADILLFVFSYEFTVQHSWFFVTNPWIFSIHFNLPNQVTVLFRLLRHSFLYVSLQITLSFLSIQSLDPVFSHMLRFRLILTLDFPIFIEASSLEKMAFSFCFWRHRWSCRTCQ